MYGFLVQILYYSEGKGPIGECNHFQFPARGIFDNNIIVVK